ncbi:MAG: CoA pyrophosphatase [Deltaproteobacteria bacterium]|nr:CoA pyrophosphatase [Deltaproteobacteria bacterium]
MFVFLSGLSFSLAKLSYRLFFYMSIKFQINFIRLTKVNFFLISDISYLKFRYSRRIIKLLGGGNMPPGQWAFPGGRMDAGESPEDTALRELAEEVGLKLRHDRVIGRLDDFTTRSGFTVTPVVVWGGPGVDLTPNPAEVESIHRIPIAEFLRNDAPILEEIPESRNPVLLMPVGNSWIAAPTAALIYQFREVAILGKNTRVAHYEQPFFAWN